MALAIEYFDASGTAAADGVYIPLAALPGVVSTELASAQSTANKEAKVLLALSNQLYNTISPTTFRALGFATTKSAPAGVSADIVNQSFSFSWQKLVNLDTDVVTMIPEPSAGANNGLGSFSISDLFPSAVKVAAAGAVAAAGIVINTSGLTGYSSLTHAGFSISSSTDNRDWLAALLDHMALDSTVRSTTVASGIVAATASSLGATAIPANFTQATDPLSGIASADVSKRGLVTRTLNYTVQLELNQATQVFDVRVATA